MAKMHKDLLAFLESQRNNLEAVAKMMPTVPDEIARLSQEIKDVISTAASSATEFHDVCIGVQALKLVEERKLPALRKAETLTTKLCLEKANEEILRWISPLEPSKRHQDVRSLRLHDTCQWMLQHPEFLDWSSDTPTNRTLCCFGNPGVGKTIVVYVSRI
jgi:hypothetical protein